MFSLDAILDATESRLGGRPDIVSQNHDAGDINFVAGMSDPGEMIGCGMYQQLRRHANETDAAYAARLKVELRALPPEHRARIEDALRKAALRRAALDTSNGRVNVMVAGQPAWHGLGVNVAAAVSSKQAAELAGLGWAVEKAQQFFLIEGKSMAAAGQFALYRADTGAYLGSVGSRYNAIQNADAFDFLDTMVGEFGARYETAGSVHGGKKVWMQIELPRQSFEAAPGDQVRATAVFTNPHDGSGQAWVFPTTERVVCNNTLRVASRGKQKGIGLRHTGSIKGRIESAREALGLAVKGFEEFKGQADALAHTPIRDAQGYFGGVLDAILDVTAEQAKLGVQAYASEAHALDWVIATSEQKEAVEREYKRAVEYRTNVLDDILERYEGERCAVGGIRGTAWAALNAVTEAADHGRLGDPRRRVGERAEQDSRRFESILAGDRDDYKQVALQQALALAAN